MNFDDYLRDEAAKYRQLAEDADDSSTPPALPLMAEPSKAVTSSLAAAISGSAVLMAR
jgi:hypothetical protein